MSTRIYTSADLIYINRFKEEITTYAAQLGVSATAVAAAIAKENSKYNENKPLNNTLDTYAAWRLDSHTAVINKVIEANAYGLANQAPNPVQKFDNPALIDMGVANIKLTTAVGLLDRYYAQNPNSDPLGLDGYKGTVGSFEAAPGSEGGFIVNSIAVGAIDYIGPLSRKGAAMNDASLKAAA